MRWQCEYCDRSFLKSNGLSQHISQKHPWLHNVISSPIIIPQQTSYLNDEFWNIPQIEHNVEYLSDNSMVNIIQSF